MDSSPKYAGAIVEYLDRDHFRAGFVLREQDRHLALLDHEGRERLIARDLVMVRHGDRTVNRDSAAHAIAELSAQRAALAKELDLQLLWEVVQEHGRSFTAAELAGLFFGRRSNLDASVMLEALL
ncbi:MAG TPA: hypothetical protein VIX12_01750, partial [Candidatus Binataceae bacterium]